MDCLWILCALIIAHWVRVAIVSDEAVLLVVQQMMSQRILLSQQQQQLAIFGVADDFSSVACHNFTSDYLGINDSDIADTVCGRIYWIPERTMLVGEARKAQDAAFALPKDAVHDMCYRLVSYNPSQIPEELVYYALITFGDICEREGVFDWIPKE